VLASLIRWSIHNRFLVLMGTLLTFRAIYYLLPLTVAVSLLGGHELFAHQERFRSLVDRLGRWGPQLAPPLLAFACFVAGFVLLVSGAWPAEPTRLKWLAHFLPLGVLETSHFVGSIVGVVLLLGVDVLAGIGQQVMAQLAILLGAFLYACAALNGRRFATLPPTVTAACTMICASVALLPAAIVIDRPWLLHPTPQSMSAALALGVFCTGLALLLYFRLLRTLGPIGVTSQSYLRCGITVLLGVIVLGEKVTATVGLGLFAIVLGVAAINAPARRRSDKTDTAR